MNVMTRHVLIAAVFLTAATLDACKSLGHGSPTAQEDIVVQVRNQSFPDVNVYVLPSGDPRRIGSVTGNSSATFKLPARMLSTGTLQLLVRPIAGRAYLLPPVSVSSGDEVEVTINNVPAQSTVTVVPR
jgi:hypothetical protein